ncbi:hypothetical protein [Planktothrix sp. FACHB-1365]|uniref:hypothetical protein n=1 Tax=Planktothrix sp. FACHB-1365 TaxID=2692855 RepID=UPI00168580F7|nr:hypothetical protein [Planktothrix sp. FACHB-1365]MBD2485350.1 hypothetical protein [Planktothrix sp. FACHB-1365]
MMKVLGFVAVAGTFLNVTPQINIVASLRQGSVTAVPVNPPIQIAQNSSSSSIQGYCFSVANDNMDSIARIYIQGNKVTGRVEATIHNQKESYKTNLGD